MKSKEEDKSREYLKQFMMEHFKDKTFVRYISETLAGDFAFQLATAMKKVI